MHIIIALLSEIILKLPLALTLVQWVICIGLQEQVLQPDHDRV
jgi:hypothetical protein